MSSAAPAQTSVGVLNLEDILANMELRALRIEYSDERARIFNLAGDLCFDAGLRERALSYYGRAIDVFIGSKQFDAAVGVCRKIVRLTPEVVRARCTLAWMALGRGLITEARQRIADYVTAASSAGQSHVAARQLRLMAGVSGDEDLLESLADALKELGDDDGADRAASALSAPRPVNMASLEAEERWSTVLKLLSLDADRGSGIEDRGTDSNVAPILDLRPSRPLQPRLHRRAKR